MKLYKFLDEEGGLKTIESNKVLLRTPEEFNDPFDSIFYVDREELKDCFDLLMNYELFKKGLETTIKTNHKLSTNGIIVKSFIEHDLPKIKKEKLYVFKDYIAANYKLFKERKNKNDIELQLKFNVIFKDVIKALRSIALVSCFSTTLDSILLWSHYANKHKGVCVEFEVEDKDFRKVVYSKELERFDLYKSMEVLFGHELANELVDTNKEEYKFMLNPIFRKSIDWEYEREVRCVFSKKETDGRISSTIENGKKLILLDMPKIKNIYIGCKATPDFIQKVKEKAKGIPIHKMEKNKDEYGLHIENTL